MIAQLFRDLGELPADREFTERIAAIGPIAESGAAPGRVASFLRAGRARWGRITREIGLLPE